MSNRFCFCQIIEWPSLDCLKNIISLVSDINITVIFSYQITMYFALLKYKKILMIIQKKTTYQLYLTIILRWTSFQVVSLVFHSSVIEDASPPACKIPFNGTYLVPTAKNPSMSLLPNCFVGDSREGYHMTYYWFKVFDWNFANTSED